MAIIGTPSDEVNPGEITGAEMKKRGKKTCAILAANACGEQISLQNRTRERLRRCFRIAHYL